ncbi:MAG: helix-hairpin-helix domain-containing protein [Clostridia bacterium]|nr:helix-hairpin-helix domain-containing protein [Clostridia bacterium]
MKEKKVKTLILTALIIVCAVVGAVVQKREKQYKSFFVERNEVNAVEESVTNDIPDETELMVNINTANIYELQMLNGIGEKTAQRIIDYRNKHGKFDVVEDLMRIDGIGKKKFDIIKDNICVE